MGMKSADRKYLLKEAQRTLDESDSTAAFCLCQRWVLKDALSLLKEQDKEIKALRLLVAYATQFDFGYDKLGDAYELYKNEIKGMEYIDGMVHIARRTLEDYGTFKK